ncbi:MAG: hypothetical protein OHK0046_45680 [Anaerolineae bacterium]
MLDIQQLQRRTTRYELADGIRDFQMAIWIFIIGLYSWFLWDMTEVWGQPMRSLLDTYGSFITLVLVFGVMIGVPGIITHVGLRLMNAYVRRRWLWRNTGYITPKSWIIPRGVLFTALAITMLVFIGGIWLANVLSDGWIIWRALWVGIGLEMAYTYFMLGRVYDIGRYRSTAVVGAVGTLITAALPGTIGLTSLGVTALWAVLFIISGVIGLREVAALQERTADAA